MIALSDIPGGRELCEWFDGAPSFHDAEIFHLALSDSSASTLRLHTWRMTDQVDEKGYFVLEKHVVVTFVLEEVTSVSLTDLNLVGIVLDMRIAPRSDGYRMEWSGSYGVEGSIESKQMRIEFKPGRPEKPLPPFADGP